MIYLLSIYYIYKLLNQMNNNLWIFIFYICTILVLIFSSLIEFRYFIISYIILSLHIINKNKIISYLIIISNTIINIIMIFIFIKKKFIWSDLSDARIIW